MELPQLQPITVQEHKIAGIPINFRKIKLRDAVKMQEFMSAGMTNVDMEIHILAHLMEGYDLPFEKRLEFLESIEIGTLEDVQALDDIVEALGLKLNKGESKKK